MYEVGGYPVGLFGFIEFIGIKIGNVIRSVDGNVFKIYVGKKVINLNVNMVYLLGKTLRMVSPSEKQNQH